MDSGSHLNVRPTLADQMRPPVAIPWSDLDADLVLGQRLDQVVAAMGNATALCQDGRSWTYRDLADASERVAARLNGIQRKGRVLLYLGNSFHHFAAAFGAWKAGWITIPMDPRYPSARNRQILEDADPNLVLTAPPYRDEVRILCDLPIEARSIDQYDSISNQDQESLGMDVGPDTPSTILYTSGSTGRPKGVLHTHASLTHMTKRRSASSHARPDDALTLFYSASVMGGLAGALNAFLNGSSLHPRDIKNDGFSDIDTWLRRHRITCCHCVTSLFREFARHIDPGQPFPDLRLIILGGEQAYPADLEMGWKVFGSQVALSCGIGSTEINSARQVTILHGTKLSPGRIPFGFPTEGVDALILDPSHRPVATGKVGEIAFRSRYLAQGYWRKTKKTRERFIPDPEGSDLTVYLTGDLGRVDAAGCLQGAGRNDHQVKIRGFRVEPGEVNAHLMAHPRIREACTTAVELKPGTMTLAAFYVTDSGAPIDPIDLKQTLAVSLPEYMVPDHFVELKALPRTPNGKVDPTALELPRETSVPAQSRPETRTERRLASIWSDVLKQHPLPIDRGFFDLGGTSLSAIALLARIEKKMHRQLPVSILFEQATIRDLACFLDQKSTRTGHSSLVPIRACGSGEPIYLIGGMTGEVFFCRRLLAHLQTGRPVFALEPDTLAGGRTQFKRIEDVAADYARAIHQHRPTGALVIAGYSFGGTVAYELARQLTAQGREVDLTVIFDSAAPEPRPVRKTPEADGERPEPSQPTTGANSPRKPSRLRFFTPGYWKQDKGAWRRRYWRLKYVRFYELLIRLRLSPPIAWRRCYAYWAAHWMGGHYRAEPSEGRTVLFRSEARSEEGDKGWRELCGDHLQMIQIPGDHGSIFREPDVQALARELDKALDGRW